MVRMEVGKLVTATYATTPDLSPERTGLTRNIVSRLGVTFIALTGAMGQNTVQAAVLAGLNGVNNHG